MTDDDKSLRRWAELMDRQASGESLSPSESAFCARFAQQHPAGRAELELYHELADLDAAPNEHTRALVDEALSQLAEFSLLSQGRDREQAREQSRKQSHGAQEEREPSRPPSRWDKLAGSGRKTRAAFGVAAVAAALGLALIAGLNESDNTEPSARQQSMETAAPQAPHSPRGEDTSRIELVYVSGRVEVDGLGASQSSALLREGSRVAVEHGGACIAMDPDIDVCLGEGSALRLSTTSSERRTLDLERGKVAVQLSTLPEGSSLSIVAGGVRSTAIGTAFSVQRGADEEVSTTVLKGRVRVEGERVAGRTVHAHQRARVRGQRSEVMAVSRSDESPEWALLSPAKLWHEPWATKLDLHGLPTGAEILLDEHVIGRAPLSSLIPVGSHRLEVRVDGRVRMRRDFLARAGEPVRLVYEPLESAAEPKPGPIGRARRARAAQEAAVREAPETSELSSARALDDALRDARRAMRAGRFEDAASTYAALRETHPDTPEARTVLVSMAELELERLGRPQAALRHLEGYLAGGQGALVQEARHARIRALRALGQDAAERDAIREFLRRHPKSLQAGTLERRLAALENGTDP